MGVFVKLQGDSVIVAGSVATDEMLSDGYFEYKGAIPNRAKPQFLKWDKKKKKIIEDAAARLAFDLDEIKAIRNKKLDDCRWVLDKYADLGQPVPEAWVAYRLALRNITDNYKIGDEIVWPVSPDEATQATA